jgi:hypothetical protein
MSQDISLDPATRELVDAEEFVMGLEARARTALDKLKADEPWTSGTTRQAQHLILTFGSVLLGKDSRLARAARGQQRPWDLSKEPMRSAVAQLENLNGRAAQLTLIGSAIRDLQTRLRSLHDEFASEIPNAWNDWFQRAGLTDELVESVASFEEIETLRSRIEFSTLRIEAWRGGMQEWLAKEGVMPSFETIGTGEHQTTIEDRYALLLQLQVFDRLPIQKRTARELREVFLKHLRLVGGYAGTTLGDYAFKLASDYAVALESREMKADEIAAYYGSLAHFSSRVFPTSARA